MADSTVSGVSKLKVVELRKELKSRGLPMGGDKSELITRLQTAMSQEDHGYHGDINLDSDEIDSDGVLEDEDDKSQTDILDDTAADSLNEELVLAEQHPKPEATKSIRTFKRKITSESKAKTDDKSGEKEPAAKKIVLNRAISITAPTKPAEDEKPEPEEKQKPPIEPPTESSKVKITADVDLKTKLELRAKRFGLPIKMSDNERKEARMKRFGQETGNSISTSATLGENIDKLKQRAERFGQSVSKIMTVIENKEKLEQRKAKFGAA